jgi:hypothetical protein
MEDVRMVLGTLVVVVLSFMIAACAGPALKIDSEQAPAVDLSGLSTYGWLHTDTPKAAAVHTSIAPFVDRQLQAKGYGLAPGQPDFQVGSEVVIERKLEASKIDISVPGQPGYRAPGGAMGWAEAQINPAGNAQDRAARIAEAVEKILERFPARR